MKCALLALLYCCSCSALDAQGPSASPKFDVVLVATRDGTQPVEGVKVFDGKSWMGATDSTGAASLHLQGQEGATVALTVECPARFASPEVPTLVALKTLAKGSPVPRFTVQCSPVAHAVAVGVRAENGPHLPVLHLKKVVGRTDSEGVAHVLLQAPANEPVVLTLDTAGDDGLRPRNPTLSFVTAGRDELVLLEQKFTASPKPEPPVRRTPRPERL